MRNRGRRPPSRLPRWARTTLRLCLLAWPRPRRAALGGDLLSASERLVAEARERGRWAFAREIAGEALGLVRGGLALRAARLRVGVSAAVTGAGGDVRWALRTLRRHPGFTFVAVTTLALGIGANAAIFTVVQSVLLEAPPYRAPDELVLVWNTRPGSAERIPMAGPDAAVVEARAGALAGTAFVMGRTDNAIETLEGDARHVGVSAATTDLFQVLGVDAAIGRTFAPGEGDDFGRSATDPGAVTVAVLSHGAWRRVFGGNPGVVGRTVRLGGLPVQVIGVLPPSFRLALPPGTGVATDVDVWVPLLVPLADLHRGERLLDQDSDNSGAVVGRLAERDGLPRLQAELAALAAELRAEVPAYGAAGLRLEARPLQADATAHARPLLLALSAGAGLVLLVACLNIAILVLGRGMGRRTELSVRSALGAGRTRILRQLVVEGAALGILGALAAVAVAHLVLAGLDATLPASLRGAGIRSPGPDTLAFGGAATGLALALAAVAPALGIAPTSPGLPGRSGTPTGRGVARRALVVGEVAVSVVLVLAAGLLLRTVGTLNDVDPGFEPDGALTFRLSMRAADRYRSPGRRAELMKEVERSLRALPGVRSVGWVGVLPLSGDRWTQPYGLPGQAPTEWEANRADFRVASSGLFEALGTGLVEGRAFVDREDLYEDERVVVVDETLARRLAPEGSAVGATIGVPVDGSPVQARIVGVVTSIRYETLEAAGREAIYVPYRQEASRDVSFVVRADGDPAALAPAVRRAVLGVDPGLPPHHVRSLADYVGEATAPRRFALTLLLGFAVLALACAALGLYGVVAFEVKRRTRDLGIRMAVGARPEQAVGAVLRPGLGLGATGVALGIPLAAVAAAALSGVLVGVRSTDPATWAASLAVVVAVTAVAAWAPAHGASRLDPSRALRSE